MLFSRSSLASFLIVSLLGIYGCNNDKSVNEELAQKGRLRLSITDAPFPIDIIEEANVTINKITIQKNDGDVDPFVLFENEITLNLLDLSGGVTEQLANIELPTGDYNQMRLFVSDASLTLKTGESFVVSVPSGSQSGIKVFVKPVITIVGEAISDLLLDVDVSQSFVLQGNINTPAGIKGFNFKPVIKAVNISHSGRLTGAVTSEGNELIEGAQISVFADDTLNNTSFTQSDGSYTIIGLIEGNYMVKAEREGYIPSDPKNVNIIAGNKTEQDFILKIE